MINRIKGIINRIDSIDGWKIISSNTTSNELFYIKENLDMNRGKKVSHYEVVVYKDFEENNEKYKGSATVKISPSMNDEEIFDILTNAAFSASFVKNKWYPLAKKTDKQYSNIESAFSNEDITPYLDGFTKAVFESDNEKAAVNSAEIFINKTKKRIVNSNEVDVEFNVYNGEIEIVTDSNIGEEEVELFSIINFSDDCKEKIQNDVRSQIEMTKERAVAKKAPSLKNINAILTNESVVDFFSFYLTQANAQAVYEKISKAKIGENFQGENIKGDLLNITLDPLMKNSSKSAPFDADGSRLEKTKLYKDGILQTYFGSLQYTSYLDIEPTGSIMNFVVEQGSLTYDEFKKEPYIELLAFSAFQMDPITGDFGGEFRLARYFDGKEIHIVTGGSISGNIFEVQKEMFLSNESTQYNNYIGPKGILFKNMQIAGQ